MESSLEGKTCIVTGANSGVGKAMATNFARRGARVVMVARNRESADAALVDVRKDARGEVSLEIADLARLSEVRALASRLSDRFPKIDVLMNNAGTYLANRHVTDEGYEVSFVVNHLAPFALTLLLRNALAASGAARVVATSSMAYTTAKMDVDDLMMERKWSALRQYANGKLGTVLFTKELAERLRGDGIRAYAYHPGGVRSGMAQDEPNFMGTMMRMLGPLLRTPEKGAETGVYLATEELTEGLGGFFVDRREKKLGRTATDAELSRKLWDRSLELAAAKGASL